MKGWDILAVSDIGFCEIEGLGRERCFGFKIRICIAFTFTFIVIGVDIVGVNALFIPKECL